MWYSPEYEQMCKEQLELAATEDTEDEISNLDYECFLDKCCRPFTAGIDCKNCRHGYRIRRNKEKST